MEMPKLVSKYELLLLAALFLQVLPGLATSGSIVEYLPGFQGPLPFHLETGYVQVGEPEEDAHVFYYFTESENNPKEDPLLIWLTGGPGCSSFSGLAYELGPFAFKLEKYNGSLPSLVLRPNSWTRVSNIIFIDLPIDAGFSYAKRVASQRSDWKHIHHAHQFLRKWLVDHPQFLSNQMYIGGDSYAGIPIPVIVQEISKGNENGIQPWINIQGYLIGNPVTTRSEKDYRVPFAHGMGLISDELYMSLQKNCKGKYEHPDSRNKLCMRDIDSFDELVSGLNDFDPLEDKCQMGSPRPYGDFLRRRSLIKEFQKLPSSNLTLPPLTCRTYGYFLSHYWTNDDRVRKALNIRKGTKKHWNRCDGSNYKYEIFNTVPYHANLSTKGYRSLIYSGDHDLFLPFLATQAWIRGLNYSIVDEWRPWFVKGQVAGYTRSYSNQMTFATVKGAGHVAPEYKQEECFAMFSRWISRKPL